MFVAIMVVAVMVIVCGRRGLCRVPMPPGKSWRTWKVLENHFGAGKSWKLKFKVLESRGKIFATRCHILRLKCAKFDFGWGSAPDCTLGELTTPPRSSSWI